MSFGIVNTSQYDIRTLSVVTKFGVFDIRSVYSELNIFDSILQPCVSGNVLILDSLGMNHTFQFDGTEFLKIEASKDEGNLFIKKTYRIYKESNRRKNTMNSESYVLHFVSNEFIFSEQQTLNNFYSGTYSETVEKILQNKLRIGSERYLVEPSVGVRDIVIPNLKPIEALIWSSKRAVNEFNLPNFLFFENLRGYNFQSLSRLKKQDVIMNVLFEPKNIGENVVREFFGARDIEIINQFDYLDNLMSGVYSGTFIGFDPITRVVIEQPISFEDMFKNDKMNKTANYAKEINVDGTQNNQMYGSRRIAYVTELARSNTSYILTNNKNSLNLKETPEYFALQRKAILKQLFSQRIKITVPGNFLLTSGVTLNILKQKNSYYDDENENIDTSIFGKYLIVAARHIMKDNKHTTVLELVTDSKDVDENLPAMNVKEATK